MDSCCEDESEAAGNSGGPPPVGAVDYSSMDTHFNLIG